MPQNFKVRRLTFPNISKRTKTGVFQHTLALFHRHYSLERNKKSVAMFFRQFSDEENKKKKSKQIGQEKVPLTITGAGVVARKLLFSNNISELLDGAPPAPRWLFHYITVTISAAGLSRTVIVSSAGDTVKQRQRRVTSPKLATVIEACLLTNRSKMFRQHLKCSLTAPRRAGTSSGFFLVSFNSASCLSLGDLSSVVWASQSTC